LITSAEQAESILGQGQADLILMARDFLRHPYWPLQAAARSGVVFAWPAQYQRAAPDGTPIREA
jgi:2,4-dienoyl-CoA reductase-like NADH-dependent reductase (Old Yellow Enzyme family)